MQRLAFLLLLTLLAAEARAQYGFPERLSDAATISLVTVRPGEAVHAVFGHSALRVQDPAQDLDVAFNYGVFDFGDPLFVPKFTYGQLDYFLAALPYPRSLYAYKSEGRSVLEQELALAPEQEQALYRFLLWNVQPENRTYRYDFLFDNCATRIRDALRYALDDAVDFTDALAPEATFRDLLHRYIADDPALILGFDLGLGTPVDRPVTAYESMFLPDFLAVAFDAAEIRWPDGTTRPLVARVDTVVVIPGYDGLPEPTFPWPTLAAWLLFLLGAATALWSLWRGRPPSPRADALLLFVVGLVGILLLYLWPVSLHEVTGPNWNLAWAWPTHLAAAWAVARGHSRRHFWRGYLLLAAVGSALVAGGWWLWPQDLHAALLPVTLLVAVRCGVRWCAEREA